MKLSKLLSAVSHPLSVNIRSQAIAVIRSIISPLAIAMPNGRDALRLVMDPRRIPSLFALRREPKMLTTTGGIKGVQSKVSI